MSDRTFGPSDVVGIVAYFAVGAVVCIAFAGPRDVDSVPPGLLPIRSCQIHDLDTLVKCDVLLAWDVALVNQSIRLHGVDALEVDKTRQTVRVTDDEVARGQEGRDKLAKLADGARWFVRPTGNSVYGRREGELYFRTRIGKWIDVAEWIRTNGYERGKQ